MGRLAKTDTLDAEVIALFAERIRPPVRPLPEPERSHFVKLVSRRRQIIGMINMETSRRDLAVDRQLIRRPERHAAVPDTEIAELDGDISQTIRPLPSGADPGRCSGPFPGLKTSPRARFWLNCLNSAPSGVAGSRLSSPSIRSTATLA